MDREIRKARVREHTYYLDKEGLIYLDGSEVEDPRFYNLALRTLQRSEDGRYMAVCQGERCYFQVEDVPYVVIDLALINSEGDAPGIAGIGPDRAVLMFRGDYREELNPSTLYVGKDNVLYCRVRGGAFKARFSRKAYYDLARHIDFDPKLKQFYLRMGSNKYPVIEKSLP